MHEGNVLFWAEISEDLWNDVPQNKDSYMLDDETTPVKACGDLAYNVNGKMFLWPEHGLDIVLTIFLDIAWFNLINCLFFMVVVITFPFLIQTMADF